MEHDDLRPFAAMWNLSLDGPVLDTPSSRIAFGCRNGSPVVLKVAKHQGDEAGAHRALLHFAGCACVRLLDRANGAVLLERLAPGRPLTKHVLAGQDDAATAAVCDVARSLHRPAAPDGGFPMIEDWGLALEQCRRRSAAGIPGDMLQRACALFAELAASQGDRKLLHGDLHHDNILWDAARGWVAVDPKGVIGEPAYELGAMLRNPTENPELFAQQSIAARRAGIIAERLACDADRVLAWGFAQAVLSAVWALEDGADPTRGLATARAIWPLL